MIGRLVGRAWAAVVMIGLAVGGLGAAATAQEPADVAALQAEIETLVDEHLGETTPGAMVAVVDAKGPLLMETWGTADPAAQVELTVDSRTPVASVSKVVTSLTALTLHHEGLLDLDVDLRGQLPVRDERAASTPVTGRHLLTHHSGIVESLFFHPDPLQEPHSGPLREALEDFPPVLAQPSGLGMHYSPLQGYTLLGAAIEQATGESFDDATSRWVLDPVGATDAAFDDAGSGPEDVVLSTRDGEGWSPATLPAVAERPAASLAWSTRDAATLLHTLLDPEQDQLPAEVVEEAMTTAIRPAHGAGGHTQVFFEAWREDVRVLEHAGANGLAWFAVVPEAGVGVFAGVTTMDAAAAELTSDILDTVAAWTVSSGRTQAAPLPADGMPTIVPDWARADAGQPVAPVGRFHQRLFGEQGPELPLRTLTGQVAVSQEGADLRLGDRLLTPSGTEGRWCDQEGCIAGVEASDGTVLLLRGDRAMLEQTHVPAPWWADLNVVLLALGGTLLLAVVTVLGSVRAWWRRRREQPVGEAVGRALALGWTLVALALAVLTPLLPLSTLLGSSAEWLDAGGLAVWGLRALSALALLLGAAWLLRAVTRWRQLSTWRRVGVVPAALVGVAMSIVLVTWALPAV